MTSEGYEVCTGCLKILHKPIYSSDDPRLKEAGLMRSPHHEAARGQEFKPMPLVDMLLGLHIEAEIIGLQRAPKAPYIFMAYGVDLYQKAIEDDCYT